MDLDHVGQADLSWIKIHQHCLGQTVIWWLRTDESLLYLRYATQMLENGLGAPVAAATKAYTLHCQPVELTRNSFG